MSRRAILAVILAGIALGAAAVFWVGQDNATIAKASRVTAASPATAPESRDGRSVLYWYDPMHPVLPINADEVLASSGVADLLALEVQGGAASDEIQKSRIGATLAFRALECSQFFG